MRLGIDFVGPGLSGIDQSSNHKQQARPHLHLSTSKRQSAKAMHQGGCSAKAGTGDKFQGLEGPLKSNANTPEPKPETFKHKSKQTLSNSHCKPQLSVYKASSQTPKHLKRNKKLSNLNLDTMSSCCKPEKVQTSNLELCSCRSAARKAFEACLSKR